MFKGADVSKERQVPEGAPLLLMQEIAWELYLSTPGLEKEIPIKTSKIFTHGELFHKPKDQ